MYALFILEILQAGAVKGLIHYLLACDLLSLFGHLFDVSFLICRMPRRTSWETQG